MNNISEEQRIERCHVQLMKHPNFVAYSGVLMVGSCKVDDDCPTAYTNGRDVVYGREFIRKLTESDIRGLILHENKHKMYRHLATWQDLHKINAQVANMACDYVINLEIQDEGQRTNGYVTVPSGGLVDEKFRGMNSRQVFDILMQDPPDPDGSGGGGSLDEHGWEDAKDMSEQEQKELAQEIDNAMSAKVDWREALREFVSSVASGKDDSTWRKPNRRWLQHDIYMPSTISETMGRLVVAVDTSGSIDDVAVNRFLSEVVAIMNNVNPELVDLMYWGSDVVGHEVYGQGEGDKLMASTKPKGGGGTSPSCITKYIADNNIKPEAVVVLTDGYVGGDWGGHWNCPVLWCIVGNCKDVPSVGAVIHVED
jgi:predicted metal-dependent peptidase